MKSLYYTSAGVLVRQGDNPYSDGGGPQRFSLVEPDGTVEPISVLTEETVHATDPTQPYLPYAETRDGSTDVVVWNVESDAEQARVPLPDGLRWGAWPAPPVALSGDTVYVGTADTARTVNWRTGEVAETDAIPPGYPEVHGGRAVTDEGTVVDATTGQVLLEVDGGEHPFVQLSPDGRYALVSSWTADGAAEVYDVATGSHVEVPAAARGYGWSADGRLFALDGSELTTCSPVSGECSTRDVDLVQEPKDSEGDAMVCDENGKCRTTQEPDFSGELRLGGLTYES